MDEYEEIHEFLTFQQYPTGFSKNQKRVLRRRSQNHFRVKLFYSRVSQIEADDAKRQGKRRDREWRQVAWSEAQRERIIHSCHSSLEGTNNYGTPNATKIQRTIHVLINWQIGSSMGPGLYFDQTRMRKHLMHCLEAQYLSTFPIVQKRRRAAKSKLSSTIRLYCSCRMLEIAGRTMIQCCACKEWLHVGICVTVPNEALDSATKWFCNNCT